MRSVISRWFVCIVSVVLVMILSVGIVSAAESKNVSLPITGEENIYAILYSDGTLVVQHGNETDASYGSASEIWTDFTEDPTSYPWNDHKSDIFHVVFKEDSVLGKVQLTYLASMFDGCSNLVSADMSGLDVSLSHSTAMMFRNCESLADVVFFDSDIAMGTTMDYMFQNCNALTEINFDGKSFNGVVSMGSMFNDADGLRTISFVGSDLSTVANMGSFASSCDYLTSIDFSNADMSGVQNLQGAFSSLKRLSYAGFKNISFDSLTNMAYTFQDSFLSDGSSMDLSGSSFGYDGMAFAYTFYNSGLVEFKAPDVDFGPKTDMINMFNNSQYLRSVDLMNADMSGVTNFYYMFSNCYSLTTANFLRDIKNMDLSSVTSMYCMFISCSAIKDADFSGMDISCVTTMYDLFYGCSSLETVSFKDVDLSSLETAGYLLYNCYKLTSADFSGIDFKSLTNVQYWFEYAGVTGDSYVTLHGSSFPVLEDYAWMFGYSNFPNVDLSGVTFGSKANLLNMFNNSKAVSVDLSDSVFEQGANANSMFYYAQSLRELIVDGCDFSGVVNANSMFYYCGNLQSIDFMKKLDFSSLQNTGYMFYYCNSIREADLSGISFPSLTYWSSMFYYCSSLEKVDFSFCSLAAMNGFSPGPVYGGGSVKVVSFHGIDMPLFSGGSQIVVDLYNLELLDFSDANFPSYTGGTLFYNISRSDLTIDFSRCHMTNATSLGGFLTNLSVYNMLTLVVDDLDLPLVTSTGGLLSGANVSNLTFKGHLYLPSLTSMSGTFYGNTVIKTVTADTWDFPVCTDLNAVFSGCSYLKSFDVADWNIPKVTGMSNMFGNCSNLVYMDMKGWHLGSLNTMYQMFYNCYALSEVDFTGTDLSTVENMSQMFYNCNRLMGFDMSEHDLSSLTAMSSMFYGCGMMEYIDFSGSVMSSLKGIGGSIYGCQALKLIDFTDVNFSSMLSFGGMVGGCGNLDTISFKNAYLPVIISFSSMSNGSYSLRYMDLSGADMPEVTNMGGLFASCIGKDITVNVDGLKTPKLTSLQSMFPGLSSTQSIVLTGEWDTSSVTSIDSMFGGCSGLKTLDLGSFDTSSVTSMSSMFGGCSALIDIRFGDNFVTDNVLTMASMFASCRSLPYLDLSMFDTTKVEETLSMFAWCDSLSRVFIGENFFNSEAEILLPIPPEETTTGKWVFEPSLDEDVPVAFYSEDLQAAWDDSMVGMWIWQTPVFTIIFDAPDADSGHMDMQKNLNPKLEYVIPENQFVRDGHSVVGWADMDNDMVYLIINGIAVIPANMYESDMIVTLTPVWGQSNTTSMVTGELDVVLHGGERAIFKNLPAGTVYQVWEETPDGWRLIQQSNVSGVIEAAASADADFINLYDRSVTTVSFVGIKTLDGRGASSDGNGTPFLFVLEEDGRELQKVEAGNGGFIKFDPIIYTEEDVRLHTYTIREVTDGDPNPDILYDDHGEVVYVDVRVDSNGNLSSMITYDEDGIRFANHTIPGGLELSKVGDGVTDANKGSTFRFRVKFYDENGKPLDDGIYKWYVKDSETGELVTGSNGNGETPSEDPGE